MSRSTKQNILKHNKKLNQKKIKEQRAQQERKEKLKALNDKFNEGKDKDENE